MTTGTAESALPLVYNGVDILVKQHRINSADIYRVVFADKRPPLIITTAKNDHGKVFWTSVPEGRLQEAEGIARLVDEYFLLL
jgi:hypothetical protein